MQTKIESDGKHLFIPIPEEILAKAGYKLGQLFEIVVSESSITLVAVSDAPEDPRVKRLVALAHAEALQLFEGDTEAKIRWMTLPRPPLGGRKPCEMLGSENDIEALRLFISRLEHGSMP